MNETNEETVVETPQPAAPDNSQKEMLLHAVDSYATAVVSAGMHIDQFKALIESGDFKYVSKKARNAMLHRLLDESREIEELSKVVFRALKKVKRERMQDDGVDRLLGINIEGLNGDSQDDNDEE